MTETAAPPDGGWGWMCVAGRFLMLLIVTGLDASHGVLYMELLHRFNAGASVTAWLSALPVAVRFLAGVGVSMLVNIYGVRRVAIAGGLLFSAGFISSIFVPNIGLLYLTLGIVGGGGAALAYTPPVIITTHYFRSRLALATGVGSAGTGIGIFLMPNLVNLMLLHYGFSGCMLLLGGIALHLLICGALYSPVDVSQKLILLERKKDCGKQSDNSSVRTPHDEDKAHCSREVVILTNDGESIDETLQENPTVSASLLSDASSSKSIKQEAKTLTHEDNLSIFTCSQNVCSIGDQASKKKTLFDFSLLRNGNYIAFCTCVFFANLCICPYYILLPDAAKSDGLPTTWAVFLLSASGASDIISKFVAGPCFDCRKVKPFRGLIWELSIISMGVFSFLTAFAHHMWSYYVLAVLYGAVMGVYASQKPTVLVDIVGFERLGNAYGLSIVPQGIACLIAAPVAGALRDVTGDYQWSFVFVGVCGTIAGLVVFIPRIRRCFKQFRSI